MHSEGNIIQLIQVKKCSVLYYENSIKLIASDSYDLKTHHTINQFIHISLNQPINAAIY